MLQLEELQQLEKQYYELNETLSQYRRGMKSRKFRKECSETLKSQTMAQYRFLKMAQNETMRVFLDHSYHKPAILRDAVRNRNLKLGMRWKCVKLLCKIPMSAWR